eukprot:3362272-Prymnesium_polylepis.1
MARLPVKVDCSTITFEPPSTWSAPPLPVARLDENNECATCTCDPEPISIAAPDSAQHPRTEHSMRRSRAAFTSIAPARWPCKATRIRVARPPPRTTSARSEAGVEPGLPLESCALPPAAGGSMLQSTSLRSPPSTR